LGQYDVGWLAYYLFPAQHLGIRYQDRDRRRLDLWAQQARVCSWWWPYANVSICSERPVRVRVEPNGRPRPAHSLIQEQVIRLHSADGPAVGFADGWGIGAWHGVRVPKKVIEQPEALTAKEVLGEANAEVRRVMIERLGADRLLTLALEVGGAGSARTASDLIVHQDTDQLGARRRLLRLPIDDDEPVVMVEVLNSTAEPDGSFRSYMLRVPPAMRTCQEALAWTFDVEPGAYAPARET